MSPDPDRLAPLRSLSIPPEDDDRLTVIVPVPEDLDPPTLKVGGRLADVSYEYRNAAGERLGYVLRWECRNGIDRKTFRPAVACRAPDGAVRWAAKSWPKPAPLYRLDHLAAIEPETIVLLVEGEKSAEAIATGPLTHAFLAAGADPIGLTWPGGTHRVGDADYRPLAGTDVIVLPDADAPGATCADALVKILKPLGLRRLRRWTPPPGLPEGSGISPTPSPRASRPRP